MARTITLLLFPLLAPWAAPSEAPPERAVIEAVQRLFDAMAAGDAGAAREVLLPGGTYRAARQDGAVNGGTHEEFAGRLAKGAETLLERMWNPRVLIHGRLAVLWTEYDFHRGGKFSHCGVDAFNLVDTAAGWKIAGFTYTVETTGCRPSPLGPPAGTNESKRP